MADDTYDGRKPAFNFRGQVRGLRSRPGAPQADLTGGQYDQFKSSLTPKSNWESIFRPRMGGAGSTPSGPTPLTAGGAIDPNLPQSPAWGKVGTGSHWGVGADGKAGFNDTTFDPLNIEGFDPADKELPWPTAKSPGFGSPSLDILANGGPSHTERWSQPDKKDTFGWTATPVDQQKSIASKYGASFGMGWDSAFRKTNG